MLFRRLSLATLAFLSAASFLQADILVLKNGDRKEGTILSESPDKVRMKYRLTPKIWDEKEFPRADVAEIIRQRPSELALQEQNIKDLLPTKDMMGADEYERIIQDRLRPFVNQFSGTPEATEVEQMIKDLQSEKEKVVSGQLKVDNKWLSPEEVKRDDYNIRANRLRNEMKAVAASQRWEDWVEALRIYDRFIDPDTGYFASTHYPLLVPEVLDVMKNYEAVLLKMIREQPVLQKSQEESMSRLVEPDLSRTKNAIQQKLDEWKAKYEAEKRNRVRWLIPYKMDIASLNEAHKALVSERARLATLDLDAIAKQNELLVSVFRYLTDENATEAEAALDNAVKVAGSNNRDYSRIIGELRGKVTALKNEIQKKKNAQRTFNAGSSAVGGGTGPIMDDKVAKAFADAESGSKPAAPVQEGTAPTPAAVPPKAAPPTPAAPASSAPTPVVEEESSSSLFIIAGLALLAVLVIAMVMQKKKKTAEE